METGSNNLPMTEEEEFLNLHLASSMGFRALMKVRAFENFQFIEATSGFNEDKNNERLKSMLLDPLLKNAIVILHPRIESFWRLPADAPRDVASYCSNGSFCFPVAHLPNRTPMFGEISPQIATALEEGKDVLLALKMGKIGFSIGVKKPLEDGDKMDLLAFISSVRDAVDAATFRIPIERKPDDETDGPSTHKENPKA